MKMPFSTVSAGVRPCRSPTDAVRPEGARRVARATGGEAETERATTSARDTYIDFVRGLMILSVIHIHTVYWALAPFTPDIIRHLAYLVDIPIFFFISGYLFRNATFLVAVRSAWRQFLRIYLHYVAISFLVAGGILAWLHFGEHRMEPQVWAVLGSIFSVNLQGRMWNYLRMYDGNLWYIRTYFSLLVLAPFLVGLPFFRKAKVSLLVFVIACYALTTYPYESHVFLLAPAGQVLFYAMFFVLGALVRAGEPEFGSKPVAWSLGLNLLLAWLVYHSDGNQLILNPYKFPPTFQYLVYTMLLIHVFLLAKPHWGRVNARVVAPLVWAGRNSLVLYLIQGAVCSAPLLFVNRLGTDNAWALYALVFTFNVLVTFALSGVYVAGAGGVRTAVAAARRRLGGGVEPKSAA